MPRWISARRVRSSSSSRLRHGSSRNAFACSPSVTPLSSHCIAIHPDTGDVWASEHGPQGGDELNRIQPGKNYGWPVIGFGVNYQTGLAIHAGTHREGMEQPTHIWVPSIGVSGLMVYTGERFPQWRGNIFAGGMVGQQLARLTMLGQRVTSAETLVPQMGRIRDVRQGLDGYIYLVTDDREGKPTPIFRMEPVERNSTR